MNLGFDLSMKLQQKLSFQMIQSLKLLQVNTLQLEQLLKAELEMNPMLETSEELDAEIEQTQDDPKEEQKEEKEDAADEIEVSEDTVDWEEYLEEGFDLGYSYNEETDPNEDRFEPTTVYQKNLDEFLNEQLADRVLPERKMLLVQLLIGSLDQDGYLRLELTDLATFAQADIFEIEEALQILQSMDPPGIGARNLKECMMLQLRKRGLQDSLANRIISERWDLFEKLKIPDISRHFNIELKDVQDAIDVLKTLTPKPGYQHNPDKSSSIIPDLIVEKIDGEFVVMLNDRSIPSLHINKAYANLLKKGSSAKGDVKKYVREKFNSASWFIKSIEQRKSTMIRVMTAIVDRQPNFFEKGPPNLSPLKLQDIADMIEMHISTVSRVTSNKYVQTRHGIFELKYFFTEAVGHDEEGADISSERIKNRIKELVEAENPKKPLSDQKISEMLEKETLGVARRTVAKYREQLKILPARMRQKYD